MIAGYAPGLTCLRPSSLSATDASTGDNPDGRTRLPPHLHLSHRERRSITGKALRSRHELPPHLRLLARSRSIYAGKELLHQRDHFRG
jgi:hypothetical protein